MKKKIILILVAFFLSVPSFAQLAKADELFKKGFFDEAKQLYNVALDAGNIDNNALANLGFCYVAENNYKKAEEIFAQLMLRKKVDPEYHFYYGEILRINGKYAEAKTEYEQTQNLFREDESYIYEQRIASCDSMMKWKNHTSEVEISNCQRINSPEMEFCAVRYGDYILYISGKKNVVRKWDGKPYFMYDEPWAIQPGTSDIYYLSVKDSLSKPKKLNSCTAYDYGMFSVDNKGIITYTAKVNDRYWERKDEAFLIYQDKFSLKGLKPEGHEMDLPITEEFSSGHPFMNASGDMLFFSAQSDHENLGKSDIYCSKKVNGEWSEPQNLGYLINTAGNELYPYFHNDTLYFSTDGRAGYGGLDIFYAVKKGDSWSKAINLKAPFNSTGNDYAFNFSAPGKGFFTSDRSVDGRNNDDVYGFAYPQPEPIIVEPQPDTTAVAIERLYPEKLEEKAVFFETNKATVVQQDVINITQLADTMLAYPLLKVKLIAHTDIRGSNELNTILGQRRADTVASYLLRRGVEKERIQTENKVRTDERTSPFIFYRAQIGFSKSPNSKGIFARKYNLPTSEVSTYPFKDGYCYTIGNYRTLEEAEKQVKLLNEKYRMGAFVIMISGKKRLQDIRYSINRRVEIRLYY